MHIYSIFLKTNAATLTTEQKGS